MQRKDDITKREIFLVDPRLNVKVDSTYAIFGCFVLVTKGCVVL